MFSIQDIRVEHQISNRENPVITDRPDPRFTFWLNSDRGDFALRSASIQAGDWKCEVTDPLNIQYDGPALEPLTEYRVRVEAQDDRGETAAAETVFQTGRMGMPWKGDWIGDERNRVKSPESPAPTIFHRRFHVQRECQELRIFATALGIFDLYLDGSRINNDYFAPGFTNYEADLQYTVHTVRGLAEGDHELAAVVAAGWACGRTTHVDNTNKSVSLQTAERPALLGEFHLIYSDGETEIFGTDPSFEVTSDGPLRFADFYDGEVYDARKKPEDLIWYPAAVQKTKVYPEITVRCGCHVTAREILTPVGWQEGPDGELIVDFGQNIAGVVAMQIRGKEGQEIVIRHAEALEHGKLYVQNLRSAKQMVRYICRDGEQEYSPRFTYMGFRYIGIRGAKKEEIDVKAIAVYSALENIGSFRCSNEDLNQLQSNLVWSGKDNFVDIPTDCPQRDERQGWTGDIALFSPTACFNFDMSLFLEKWLRDLTTEQTGTGAIPFVIPARKGVTPTMTTSCWGDCSILVPWALYQANGDKSILRRQYPSMKKYLADVKRWAALSLPIYGSAYILKLPFQFGDWCAPYGSVPDWLKKGPWVGTAYFYHSSRIMAQIAGILEKKEDSRRYLEQADKIRRAFRKAFTDGKGRLKEEFQTAYVLALAFGLAEENERPVMAERLKALIRENGGNLSTGFTATPFLLFALADNGCSDEAYKLLLKDTDPSWLYQVRHGATTLWEQWGAVQEDGSIKEASLNHYAYGSVGGFFYRRICGLDMLDAGYRRFAVKPVPGGDLAWAECEHHSPFGLIKVRWDRTEDSFVLKVTVPAGTECEVTMPGGEHYTVRNGSHMFELDLLRHTVRYTAVS